MRLIFKRSYVFFTEENEQINVGKIVKEKGAKEHVLVIWNGHPPLTANEYK